MEKANQSLIRLATIKYNHQLLTTPLSRYHLLSKRISVKSQQFTLKELGIEPINTTGYVSDNSVELLVVWLQSNIVQLDSDIQLLWNKFLDMNSSQSAKAVSEQTAKLKRAYVNVMKFRKATSTGVAGSTLLLTEKPSFDSFIKAWRLATLSHPFSEVVYKYYTSQQGVNGLDFNTVEIFNTIDFPLTSISNMITAIGLPFVKEQRWIDNGWIISHKEDGNVILFYDSTPSKFKIGTPDAIAYVINNMLVEHKFSHEECTNIGLQIYSK